jgi:hypothetical protein
MPMALFREKRWRQWCPDSGVVEVGRKIGQEENPVMVPMVPVVDAQVAKCHAAPRPSESLL